MSVTSPMYFIAPQQKTSSEKAYQLKYDPPDGFPPTNIVSDEYSPTIEDVRGQENHFSVDRNGFAILEIEDRLSYNDYGDETKIRQTYFPHVAEAVKKLLGAARVQIFEHVVRKRHAGFPIATGQTYEFNQPTTAAHIDVTPAWASALAEHMNKMKGSDLPSERFQFIKCSGTLPSRTYHDLTRPSIWKPLRGPVKDWPLAVCDAASLDQSDVQECDVVFGTQVIENYLVQHNPQQRWYYLSDQTPSEAWVFMQSDTANGGLIGAPHSSFLHPGHAESVQPRESIEVRAIAFY
nr:hypothetical protein CFP56_67778 [Quercus suber]